MRPVNPTSDPRCVLSEAPVNELGDAVEVVVGFVEFELEVLVDAFNVEAVEVPVGFAEFEPVALVVFAEFELAALVTASDVEGAEEELPIVVSVPEVAVGVSEVATVCDVVPLVPLLVGLEGVVLVEEDATRRSLPVPGNQVIS